jgi:hypothetical protein
MSGQEPTRYEAEQLERIKQWEAEEPGVVSKTVGFITAPLAWVAQKVIPEAAIRGALDFTNSAAKFLTDSDDLLRDAHVSSLAELKQLPLERLDELANEVHNWAIAVATGEGAGTRVRASELTGFGVGSIRGVKADRRDDTGDDG